MFTEPTLYAGGGSAMFTPPGKSPSRPSAFKTPSACSLTSMPATVLDWLESSWRQDTDEQHHHP
ncbi:MAG: hypothetical protein U1E76_24820 [Planctomycetota bacterium]